MRKCDKGRFVFFIIFLMSILGSKVFASVQTYCYKDAGGITHILKTKKNKYYKVCTYEVNITSEMKKTITQLDRSLINYSEKRPTELARNFTSKKYYNFNDYIYKYAKKHNVDARLVYSVISVESGFNPNVVSPRGAVGLMQLMPATAIELAKRDGWTLQREHLLDPETNISLGVQYLAELSKMFDNNMELTLAAYNAGMGNVQKFNFKTPPFHETQRYIDDVISVYSSF